MLRIVGPADVYDSTFYNVAQSEKKVPKLNWNKKKKKMAMELSDGRRTDAFFINTQNIVAPFPTDR